MSQNLTSLPDDLAQLQQQLTEFRSTHRVRSRLPEPFWAAATEVAKSYGVHRTARVLHLDYVGLKKRVETQKRPKAKRKPASPTFVELVGPVTSAVNRCLVEVEATPGKLRLELPAMEATELPNLLRAFLGH
ncbi:MAG: hypothetical protein JO210_05630 [Acidobacteriaceae bacterium]|nr:hypothetical protein [Acidobacteriaceae bacterium]